MDSKIEMSKLETNVIIASEVVSAVVAVVAVVSVVPVVAVVPVVSVVPVVFVAVSAVVKGYGVVPSVRGYTVILFAAESLDNSIV